MSYWILKTEPASYSFAQLLRDGRTRWDGIRNAQALIHVRSMRPGDRVLIYHSGEERAIVGTAMVAGEPYPDPQADDPRLVVVDVIAGEPVARPLPLVIIKADPRLAGLALVRQPRLSVVPVDDEQWAVLQALTAGDAESGS